MSHARAAQVLAQLARAGVRPRDVVGDSRRVRAGDVFAAWPGFVTDGRQHIAAAVERGAAAVLWDTSDGYCAGTLPVPELGVDGLRELAGYLAHAVHDEPSRRLWVAGVTGTNGKTTVSQWIATALTELGTRCGVIGTLGSGFPGALVESLNTTPDALALHRQLHDFVDDKAESVAMEVSSIGLEQGRVNAVEFDVAVFTNLSRDHLDYHGTMEAYGASKARLFAAPGLKHAVVNLDDAFGRDLALRLITAGEFDVVGYTHSPSGEKIPGLRMLAAEQLQLSSTGMRFGLRWGQVAHDLQVRMVAPFNISNLLATVGALLARGVDFEQVLAVIPRLAPPQGRMQLLGGVCEPLVVIDYAHSPDALAKVLEAVRETARTRGGELVCVFGCGGDRDPGKRPLMGEVARLLADRVIVTSDNPRTENPEAIIADILQGAGSGADCVGDRAQAIAIAIRDAGANDVVVIAGKGHEPYQEVHGRRLPFSDAEQAAAALIEWNRTDGGGGI